MRSWIQRYGGWLLLVVTIGSFIAFRDVSSTPVIHELDIQIEPVKDKLFLTTEEVQNLMDGNEGFLRLPISRWDMAQMEKRIETHPFVKDAQLFRDVKDHVIVKVIQSQPIARVFDRGGPDRYVNSEGGFLPTHQSQTARVVLIEFDQPLHWKSSMKETLYGKALFGLIRHLEADDFWRAQVAEIRVQPNGHLVLTPQVTRQKIEFGLPEEIPEKLEKLKLFYKEILPAKGWNYYETVNLKYKDQIICR